MNSLIRVTLAVTAMTALSIEAPQAKPRPTVDSGTGDECWNDPTTDKDTSGNIASCCYDDGCWICGVTPLPGDSCEWDGRYRIVDLPDIDNLIITDPTVAPQPPTPPKAQLLDGIRVRPLFGL